MATYAIGDLQGCGDALMRLLDVLRFDPAADSLWFVGDLVNRGPQSLATLRAVRALGEQATVVLGNHDLHLVAAAAGVRRIGAQDTLDDVLAAPDRDELIDWVRRRPLAHAATLASADGPRSVLMTHAGVLPAWSVADALARAAEVEAVLRGPDWQALIAHMYGDLPDRWDEGLAGYERLRFIINAFTRMRLVSAAEGRLEFKTKEQVHRAPPGFVPWYDVPGRRAAGTLVVFGHWSAQGLVDRPDVVGLDTGCVWGGALTAVHLENRALVQVSCPQYRRPGS